MNEPFVSVVICTRNRAQELEQYALRSIAGLRYGNYEVWIIDDASEQDIEQVFLRTKADIPGLHYFRNGKGRGLCHARNLGIGKARGEIVAFVDDDCVVDRQWLAELVKPFLADPDVMVVGGLQYRNDSGTAVARGRIAGCNMSFRREVFDRFLFDENLTYSHMHDETEFLERLRRNGLKVVYAEKAVVNHFLCFAPYRVDSVLGWPLNVIYKNAKRMPLRAYCRALLRGLLSRGAGDPETEMDRCVRMLRETVADVDRASHFAVNYLRRRDALPRRADLWAKVPYLAYALLIEIPLKAGRRRRREERWSRHGTPLKRAPR